VSSVRRLAVADNLAWLGAVEPGSVQVAYLDPPFNSGRNYEARLSRGSTTKAFIDTWQWDSATSVALDTLGSFLSPEAERVISGLVAVLGPRNPMASYLVSLASRIGAAHRALADTGSLFLHCDPSASHYLKLVLDAVFGPANFRNEIVWKRTNAHSGSRRFGPIHDVILFYSKSPSFTWRQQYTPYSNEYIEKFFTGSDARGRYQAITCTGPGSRLGTRAHYEWRGVWPPEGRHWAWTYDKMQEFEEQGLLEYSRNGVPRYKKYVHDSAGLKVQDVWSDLPALSAHASERVGYDTQKPVALLERLIGVVSDPGDIVLDPYAGTGTTAVAAERMGRGWLVADVSPLAASIALARVRADAPHAVIETSGFPETPKAAASLREVDSVSYAMWATAFMATQIDRSRPTSTIAIGRRSWKPGFLGVVPLSAKGLPVETAGLRDGVILEGPGYRNIAKMITGRTGVDLPVVSLSALTSEVARRQGRAEHELGYL